MASPGVKYLLNFLPKLLLPALLVYYLCQTVQDAAPLLRYSAVRTILYFCAGPLYLYCRFLWTRTLAIRRAHKLGATFFPVHQGKWPASLDFILEMLGTLDSEYVADRLLALAEKHGPTLTIRFLWEDMIFTTEPRYIKQILATNFPNYVKGEERFGDATSSVLGSGVFNADGDMWKFHRAMARPFFTRERVTEFDIFARHADEVIQKMKDSFNAGRPVDMQDVMARFTLDSASEFLFGSCVNSILEPFTIPGNSTPTTESSESYPTAIAFIRAFTNAQFLISRRTRLGHIWKLWEFRRDESKKFVVDIDRFLDPITEAALIRRRDMAELSAGSKVSGEIEDDMTFLDHMVTQTQDPKIIRDSLMNMLIAGRDTTASTLAFIMYMLSQHSTVLTRLRDDVMRVVGPTKVPTYDDVRGLQYLRAVINETLRLFPPVPLNVRDTINEDVWIGEDGTRYYVGPNMSAAYSVLLMHRDRTYWGEDALEFDPDRWIDDRLHRLTENPFAFLPFNAGPRICLGQQFAYNEVSFMIIRLLQSFNSIELRPEAQPKGSLPSPDWPARGRNPMEKIWPRAHLTLYVEGGLWLTMGEANVTGDA